MEQTLINELIKLICRSGGETFVGNFQKERSHDNQHASWTPGEVGEAVHYIQYINEFFGKDEAVAIVTSLITRYNINVNDLALRPDLTNKKISVTG